MLSFVVHVLVTPAFLWPASTSCSFTKGLERAEIQPETGNTVYNNCVIVCRSNMDLTTHLFLVVPLLEVVADIHARIFQNRTDSAEHIFFISESLVVCRCHDVFHTYVTFVFCIYDLFYS